MTVLIVDDQVNVLQGITSSVHFCDLGIDTVRTAGDVDGALAVLAAEPVDILLSDIEMPGRNGLDLISIVHKQYPDTIAILLTAHEDFAYAQKSISLNCFDYLVQPAPANVIESALRRAIAKLASMKEEKQLGYLGTLYKENQTVFENAISQKLLYRNPKDASDAVEELQKLGYSIELSSKTQLVVIRTEEFVGNSPGAPTQKELRTAVELSIETAFVSLPDECYLLFMNRHREFLLLLFDNDALDLPLKSSDLDALYNQLSLNLNACHTICCVSNLFTLDQLHTAFSTTKRFMQDNLDKTDGIYQLTDAGRLEVIPTSLPEYIARWTNMLQAHAGSVLLKDIYSYIEVKFPQYSNKYQRLCELHQQLTQMFFRYFFDNSIDITSLFDENYSYANYMESYNSVPSLKKAIRFMVDEINAPKGEFADFDYIEKAKTYILQNLDKTLSVKDVAMQVNLNPEYFTRLFKKSTGINIKTYITDCKITAAKDLLTNSSLPITMIALELGYNNFSHFTQIFKKMTDFTPREYRKNSTNKSDPV